MARRGILPDGMEFDRGFDVAKAVELGIAAGF
jgi:hypothetical protein